MKHVNVTCILHFVSTFLPVLCQPSSSFLCQLHSKSCVKLSQSYTHLPWQIIFMLIFLASLFLTLLVSFILASSPVPTLLVSPALTFQAVLVLTFLSNLLGIFKISLELTFSVSPDSCATLLSQSCADLPHHSYAEVGIANFFFESANR